MTLGFPIRKSPDHCMFDHSPGLIAAYHVLHRLSTPRHPPCTLSNLTTLMRSWHHLNSKLLSKKHQQWVKSPCNNICLDICLFRIPPSAGNAEKAVNRRPFPPEKKCKPLELFLDSKSNWIVELPGNLNTVRLSASAYSIVKEHAAQHCQRRSSRRPFQWPRGGRIPSFLITSTP